MHVYESFARWWFMKRNFADLSALSGHFLSTQFIVNTEGELGLHKPQRIHFISPSKRISKFKVSFEIKTQEQCKNWLLAFLSNLIRIRENLAKFSKVGLFISPFFPYPSDDGGKRSVEVDWFLSCRQILRAIFLKGIFLHGYSIA